MDQQSLHGRVVMVTGGAQGIGAGIGRAMAGAGAAVAVCDLDADLAAQTAHDLGRHGARAVAVPTDPLSSRSSVSTKAGVGSGRCPRAPCRRASCKNRACACSAPRIRCDMIIRSSVWATDPVQPRGPTE